MNFIQHNGSRACPVASTDHVVLRNLIHGNGENDLYRIIHSIPVQASHIKNWPKVQDYAVVKLSFDGLNLDPPVWSNL